MIVDLLQSLVAATGSAAAKCGILRNADWSCGWCGCPFAQSLCGRTQLGQRGPFIFNTSNTNHKLRTVPVSWDWSHTLNLTWMPYLKPKSSRWPCLELWDTAAALKPRLCVFTWLLPGTPRTWWIVRCCGSWNQVRHSGKKQLTKLNLS